MTQAICHSILSRTRGKDFGPTLLSDFTLTDSHPVNPQTLITPAWSLYGLELDAGQAVFVETRRASTSAPPPLSRSTSSATPPA